MRRFPISPLSIAMMEDFWLTECCRFREFKKRLSKTDLPDPHSGKYETVAGLVVHLLGHVPAAGEVATWNDLRFEVVDMDGFKIDKVAVSYHRVS